MAISANEQAAIFTGQTSSRQRWRRAIGPDIDGYGFILPATIVMICLVVYPFGLALYYSVSDKLIGEPAKLVSPLWDNFYYIITEDPIFIQTLKNTMVFATVSVALKGLFGLGAALLLQKAFRLKRFFRGSILIPFIAPTGLTTLGWWLIFDPTYSHINWLLANVWPLNLFGLGPYQWLGNPTLALVSCVLVNFWRGMPFFAITLFAGLVSIPEQLYEAAETDGAGSFRKFWHITLPLLRPVMAVVILFSTILTLADFNIVFVLTRGGPMNMTHLFATYSYTVGIQNQEVGLGAAISLFLFPILLLVVIFQLRLVRKDTNYGV